MTMIMPDPKNFICWCPLDEASGNVLDQVKLRAFTTANLGQGAGHASPHGRDWEQGTPSKCYIADAAWNTFGNESIVMGAWLKGETFNTTWDSGSYVYDLTAIIAKAISLNDHEYFLGFDDVYRPTFRMSNGTSHVWDTNAQGTSGQLSDGTAGLIIGGYNADDNQAFVKLYSTAGALLTSGVAADSVGFGTSGDSVPLWIGGQQETAAAGDGTHYWDGIIDETFIYKGIFSADNLEWIVNGGVGRTYSDLIAVGGVPIFY